MSNISNTHNIVKFVAGESKPFSGQRLAKVGYKNTAKQRAKYASICVSVPAVSPADISQYLPELTLYIQDMIGDMQNQVIRSIYESSGGLRSTINDAEINIPACIAYMTAQRGLSAESISAFFDSAINENLTVAFAEKLGFSEMNEQQLRTIGQHVKAHKDIMMSIAKDGTILNVQHIKAMRKCLELAESDSPLVAIIESRLVDMEKPRNVSDVLLID